MSFSICVWLRTVDGTYQPFPVEPALFYSVNEGWVPVRSIDPATGRPYDGSPGSNPGKEPHG